MQACTVDSVYDSSADSIQRFVEPLLDIITFFMSIVVVK